MVRYALYTYLGNHRLMKSLHIYPGPPPERSEEFTMSKSSCGSLWAFLWFQDFTALSKELIFICIPE